MSGMSELYTIEDAQRICAKLYEPLRDIGVFIGITGGVVYKEGPRKDVDLLLYLHEKVSEEVAQSKYAKDGLLCTIVEKISEVSSVDMDTVAFFGYVTKLTIDGIPVDILFPEYGRNDYPTEERA